jgi:formylglycine-generating enzyme required for sulfatase activity
MDKYEVSVSRFRAFTEALDTWAPTEGDGAQPHVTDYPELTTGWQDSFTIDLSSLDACDPLQSTWALDNDELPINCVNWETAFAFCIWDNGRLPTEAEWEYVAAAGAENLIFPHRAGQTPPQAEIEAQYRATVTVRPIPVGSLEDTGRGFLGHEDLSGNVAEWVFDYYAEDYTNHGLLVGDPATLICSNCVQTVFNANRVARGGGFDATQAEVRAASRAYLPQNEANESTGFRCARDE